MSKQKKRRRRRITPWKITAFKVCVFWLLLAAGIHFFRERSTVHGWTAFDNIADVDPVPGQGYGRKHLGEELSRRADESESLFIFRLAGTFADEHEGRVDVSLTGHFVLDPLTERTAAAVLHQFIKFLPASRLHSDSSFLTARHQAA